MICKNVRSPRDYAKQVFAFFRTCDRKKIRVIYAQKVPHEGVGRALMDRLTRAAGKK
jgi:L-threonylcarbamoyladenylate synthase